MADAAPEEYLAMRTMLLPKDTNGSGTIFGGVILSQIDLAGAATARTIACHRFVTVAMKEVIFRAPAFVGDEISYWGRITHVGKTSVTVKIRVEARRNTDCQEVVPITDAEVVYVAMDEQRRKIPLRRRDAR